MSSNQNLTQTRQRHPSNNLVYKDQVEESLQIAYLQIKALDKMEIGLYKYSDCMSTDAKQIIREHPHNAERCLNNLEAVIDAYRHLWWTIEHHNEIWRDEMEESGADSYEPDPDDFLAIQEAYDKVSNFRMNCEAY